LPNGQQRSPTSVPATTGGKLLAEIDTADLWGDVGPCLALHRADRIFAAQRW
jgi:hypothetical protein